MNKHKLSNLSIGLIILFSFLGKNQSIAQNYYQYFTTNVLRVDYFRTGNHEKEFISLDEIMKETVWSGSKINLIDTFNMGNYKIEVYDSASNKLIYSRGYSSLFAEWKFTEEAKDVWRSFSESFVMPFPISPVKIKFFNRNREMLWVDAYTMYVNPKDIFINPQQRHPAQGMEIHHGADYSKALDIVILSEGYTNEEMQKFYQDALRFRDYLFGCKPFNQMKDKINIWLVPYASVESGTDIPGEHIYKNTIMNSHFYTFGTERYLNSTDNKTIHDLASNVPYDQIYILVNSQKYGGAGIYNFYSIVTSDNKYSDFVFTHEFGHAMAGLGDEYYDSDVAVENFYNLKKEPWEPNLSTLVNFDTKWKKMVTPGIKIPSIEINSGLDKVGAFEGGGYLAKGVYRPCFDCSMKSIKYDYFCPVCSKAISDMVNFYAK